jgi:hypothetical protein
MTQNLSLDTITASMRSCFIRIPHLERLRGKMEILLSQETSFEEAENLFVVGEPGVGKSKLLMKFCDSHPRVVHAEFTEIPVLYVEVPSKSSIDELASAMLLKLGSPFWNCGKTKELTHQLKTLLKACKVRIILVDEVNHLVDKGGVKTHHLIADWLKELCNDARIPIILAGIPRATRLLETNDQLRSRFREVVAINPFSVETDVAMTDFRNVLKSFEDLVPGGLGIEISNSIMARRIAFATGGRLREIRRLIVRVVELAFKDGKMRAGVATFSTAFKQVIYPAAPDKRNPFSKQFDEKPLVRPGEPFAARAEG